jgi:oligopeptide transport system substrate-binding protein
MKKTRNLTVLQTVCIIALMILSACGQAPAAVPTSTFSPVPSKVPTSTVTPTPIPTNTNTPEPTAIPGDQVYPVSSLGNSIPWLPYNQDEIPMSVYYAFNVRKPPFNNVLVRQAFSAAVDKEQIAQEAIGFKFRNVTPATTLTPPQILGRDLTGDVGILFDPARAKELLQEAGYSDVTSFPAVTLLVSTRGEAAPGAYFRMAQSIADMWNTHLGITVKVEAVGNMGTYTNRLQTNPPEIYQLGWGADYNDPDNFLNALFYSRADFNYGRFNNRDFDHLVEEAAQPGDPAKRQLLYIQAEQVLTEQEAGVIPLFHTLYYQNP